MNPLPRQFRAPLAAFALSVLLIACTGPSQPMPQSQGSAPPTAAVSTPVGSAANPVDRAAIPGPDDASGDLAYQHVKALAEEIGTRVAGTPAERRAADYIAGQLRSYGYTVAMQEFPIENATASVQASGALNRKIDGVGFSSSQSLEASGQVVHVGLGRSSDIPATGLQGKVALIQRGEIQFQDKIRNATAAGAVAVVVYNNQPGLMRGEVRDPLKVPALIISQNDGNDLVSALDRGPVTATVSLKVDTSTAVNVIGRSQPGACQTVTGGHFDSVSTSPGGNDNGSGTAALLEASRVAAKRGHVRNDCFIAFSGEEEGLLGSQAFVKSLSADEKRQLRAMINLDMVGTPSRWELIGDDRLVDLALRGAQELGLQVSSGRLPPNVGSDHQSFAEADVPVLMLFRDDNRLHTPQDTAEIVQPESLRDAARLTVWVLEHLE
jgi:aminopeptidase YwaD